MTTKPTSVLSSQRERGTVPNVVLVHGAYADGSSWSEVIERLQAAGVTATAVQNPLVSLADDVAHTQRILALQHGPSILVGHSFAGTVISQAGVDPRLVGLVYVAARARRRGGLRRAGEEISRATCQCGTRLQGWVRWAHRAGVPERLRQRRRSGQGSGALRRARPGLGNPVRRENHRSGVEVKAIVVRRLSAGSDYLARV